jgi:hypothetical protein
MKHHNAVEKDEIGAEGGRGIWKGGFFGEMEGNGILK